MIFIRNKITLEQILDEKPTWIWLGANSGWWTHREDNLFSSKQFNKSGLPFPCGPRGEGLLTLEGAEAFIATAKKNPDHYGKSGIEAFLAAHNDNCVNVQDGLWCRWSMSEWYEYSNAIDRSRAQDVEYAIRMAIQVEPWEMSK
jgi:hypothetical protein